MSELTDKLERLAQRVAEMRVEYDNVCDELARTEKRAKVLEQRKTRAESALDKAEGNLLDEAYGRIKGA